MEELFSEELDQNLLVSINKDEVITDSLIMAKVFGKPHADVLRAYDNLNCDADFSQRNFALAKYKDAQGKMRRKIEMTRKGFTLMGMGFTGKKAMEWKIKFIEAFEWMEAELLRHKSEMPDRIRQKKAYSALSEARASCGVKGAQHGILTNIRNKEEFDMTAAELKDHLGAKKYQSARSAMPPIMREVSEIGDKIEKILIREKRPIVFEENKECAKVGGEWARETREKMEKLLGRSILPPKIEQENQPNLLDTQYI